MLRRILVAYDDSAPARRALEEAVRLAQAEGARLIVAAVEEGLPRYDGGSASELLDDHERRQDDCRLWLWAADEYATAKGVPATTEILAGTFERQLAAAATAHQADLVVVGRKGHPGIWKRLGHSKAERLSRLCDQPVLIVSERGHAYEEGAQG